MTTATAKPPNDKAARKGNVPVDLKEIAGRGSLSGRQAGSGLGRAMLVRGEVKAGAVVLGAFSGIPTQQLVSQVVLQQLLYAKPVLADGVTAGVGVGIHLLARSSYTLGLAFSMVAPFAATGTQYAINWIAGLLRPKASAANVPQGSAGTSSTMAGQRALGNRAPLSTVRDIRAKAVA